VFVYLSACVKVCMSVTRNVFPGLRVLRGSADLCYSIAFSQTYHCHTTDMGLVHRAMFVFACQLSLVLTALKDGQAESIWGGGDNLPVCLRSPILVLTGLGVE